jgi:hypothetical protein
MIFENQKDTFNYVMERDDLGGFWKCVDCGKVLLVLKAFNFAHTVSKGIYPEARCDSNKVVIKCYLCHNVKDHKHNVTNSQWLDQ